MLADPGTRPALDSVGEADLVVLGSGAAGLTAALTAILDGLKVVVLEVAPVLGGTSARSSGTVWVPDNALMHAAGFGPDREAAEQYLEALVGNIGPRAPWEAFLDAAPAMQADLEARAGVAFRPYLSAPDYRSDLPGAALGGRPLEPAAFDGRQLGNWFPLIADPIRELTVFGGMMVTRAEAQRLIRADRSPSALLEGAGLVLRHARDRLRHHRGTRLVMGNALIARLVHGIVWRGGLIYESAHVDTLAGKDGQVTGVSGTLAGRTFALKARRGVVLAGGGFPSDPEKRRAELPRPTPQYTPASPFARGTTIDLGIAAGGVLGASGIDNAMWFPSSLWSRPDGGLAVYPHIALDRGKPGSIAVDQAGKRFTNEAMSYHDFCRGVYAHGASAVPCWLIADRDFIRRYGFGVIRPRTPSLKAYIQSGYLKHGANLAALAGVINVPAPALAETVRHFNEMARAGRDTEFGRGETAYQRSNGDASRGFANPCLGPVGTGDLYAVALWPTPLGTSRGLAASADGEVLDGDGQAIAGLYVAGNDMQSCFAGEYPGAGAQIGQGMTFGWRVAKHAAFGQAQVGTQE
ncbi:FAD-dependent oxidoreductase [Nitratireductor indicus]|uniref:FAD-dependent oxidoreductase n=1 Tax=Nitratireductor indicus TaxID=721133 RepID=UPI002874C6BE|nr:FAD-dependent oxidoreductase [Nitratireductor indicus]MDS1136196.1 FAD-dependent oxidoreductase [Nitratireductor indicus]